MIDVRARRAARAAAKAQRLNPRPANTVSIEGDEAVLRYPVPYLTPSDRHRHHMAALPAPRDWWERRQHLFDQDPRRTGHDPLTMWLFCQLADTLDGPLTVCEFGVWRGAWIENLAIHAEDTGRDLTVIGFDTFDRFPDCSASADLRSVRHHVDTIAGNEPWSARQVETMLAGYRSVVDVTLIAGNLVEDPVDHKINASIAHYDLDFYAGFRPALDRLGEVTYLVVDDYYQPTWTGITQAVNESGRMPVNLADRFGVLRSYRAQYVYLLV